MFMTLFIFWTQIAYSQAPLIQWQNTIGGSGSDQLYSIQQTTDGGYILGGESWSDISGYKTEAGLGFDDYWVIKLDSTGTIQWQNTIGGSGNDALQSIKQTTDGGYILGGLSNSGISGDKTEASVGGSTDYWVIKLNSSGGIVWQNTIGGSGTDQLLSIQQTTDGGYILGGSSDSGISGEKTEASQGGEDYWLVKLNGSGTVIWQNTIGGSGTDQLFSIQQRTDGGYVLGGRSDSGISGDKTEASSGLFDYWVIKVNGSGAVQGQNSIGGDSFDNLYSIKQTSDGGFIVGGSSSSNISGDKTEASISGSTDNWVIKLNSTGAIVWQNTIGGGGEDVLRSIQQTNDGGYIVGGYTISGISGDKTEALLGGNDYWVIKLDSTGNIEWQNTIGGADNDFLYAIQQTSDGGYILGGYSESGISADKTAASFGGNDYWIVKLFTDACIPSTEICNSIDDNCNGIIDDGVVESISISAGGATTFCQGGSVVLTATYSGSSVQWKKNGTNITGATTSTFSVANKGTYTCQTSSVCGTATSTGIFINVQNNPSVVVSAGGATSFCAGGSVTLTASASAGVTYQWYKGVTALTGATTNTYVATVAGNYKCKVTKIVTGCYKNSNAIIVTVPCRDGKINNGLNIYPNPVVDNLYIEHNGSNEATIIIMNLGGQIFYSGQLITPMQEIDVSKFPSGMYFLMLNSEDGEIINKFTKQ